MADRGEVALASILTLAAACGDGVAAPSVPG